MILAFLLATAAHGGTAQAGAARWPQPVAADPHVQVARYDAAGVVALQGFPGFQTTIQFEDGERIENVAIGDATLWQVTPSKRADTLFVKPLGRGPATNMTVLTDRRTYTFALLIAPPRASNARAAWVLRFALPEPVRVRALVVPPPPISAEGKNADYTLAGPAAILPERVFDDGVRTYFAWGPQAPVPAIFAVNADGGESVVNFTMREGYAVVQQTAGRFVLRQGETKATVTSTPGTAQRLIEKMRSPRHDG